MPVVAVRMVLGAFLAAVDQVLHGLVGAVRPDPDGARIEHLVDDRGEVLLGEDRLALGVEDDRVGGRQVDVADVIAVRPLAYHFGPADLAAGAALVHHHDRLAERLLGDRRDDARADVGRAARRIRHHELDRLVGIVLRAGAAGRRGEHQGRAADGDDDARHHGRSSLWLWFTYSIDATPTAAGARASPPAPGRPAPAAPGTRAAWRRSRNRRPTFPATCAAISR